MRKMKTFQRLTLSATSIFVALTLTTGTAGAHEPPEAHTSVAPVSAELGYTLNAGMEAGNPDRVIRFFPSVPSSTRLRVFWAASHYNQVAGTRITFGPDATQRQASYDEVTIEVLPGPLSCGDTQGRACTWTQSGYVDGKYTKFGAHIMFGSHIIDKPNEMKTILHEMGHIFGLAHHEPPYLGRQQIMATPISSQGALEQGDINGMLALTRNFDNPMGALEQVTVSSSRSATVSGWAFDSNDTKANMDLHVYVNGRFKKSIVANQVRTDVTNARRIWLAKPGFSEEITNLSSGNNVVCVYAINVGAGTTNPLLGCRWVSVTGDNPVGSVDVARQEGPRGIRISGWTHDPDVTTPIKAHVYVNGWFKGQVTADLSRPDVQRALGLAEPNHGFDTLVSVKRSGRYNVCVYAINVGAGTANPLLGCRWVSVS